MIADRAAEAATVTWVSPSLVLLLAAGVPASADGGVSSTWCSSAHERCYTLDSKSRTIRCALPPEPAARATVSLGVGVQVCPADAGTCLDARASSLATIDAHEDRLSGDRFPLAVASASRQRFAVLRGEAVYLFDAAGKLIETLHPPKGGEEMLGLRFVGEALLVLSGFDLGPRGQLYDGRTGRFLANVGTLEHMSAIWSEPLRLAGRHAWGFVWSPADETPSRLLVVDTSSGASIATLMLVPHVDSVAALDDGTVVIATSVDPPKATLIDFPSQHRTTLALPVCP